jgi:hypothetical protein
MRSKLAELAEKRARLVALADTQRVELSEHYRRLERPVAVAEGVIGLARKVSKSPLFITALAAGLVRTPWRRLARVPKLAWRGWKILQFVRRWAR